jgi:hypothetical protein
MTLLRDRKESLLLSTAGHHPSHCSASRNFSDRLLTQRARPSLGRSSLRPPLAPAGGFETAYSTNRRDAIENIVDADPVAARVREIMANRARKVSDESCRGVFAA